MSILEVISMLHDEFSISIIQFLGRTYQIQIKYTRSKIDKNHIILSIEYVINRFQYASPLRLASSKKYSTGGDNMSTRVSSVADTLTLITPLCKKIGVTRISDITYMDRLYIPNYVSILPGTEDTIWVYGGKGPSNAHAKASALMESIERYCSFASTSSKSLIKGTYTQLSKQYQIKYCILTRS